MHFEGFSVCISQIVHTSFSRSMHRSTRPRVPNLHPIFATSIIHPGELQPPAKRLGLNAVSVALHISTDCSTREVMMPTPSSAKRKLLVIIEIGRC